MLKSLRSRLLLSYLAIIALVLLVLALFLFVASALISNAVRIEPTFLQLRAVSLGVRQSAERLIEAGGDFAQFATNLDGVAAETGVRIAVVDAETRQVRFDTGQTWQGLTLDVNQLERFDQFTVDAAVGDRLAFFARFRAPDGGRWLVYSQPIANRQVGRVAVVYAKEEVTPFSFFRQTFLAPLCLAGLGAFLLAMLLAWGISRSVARPLQEMAHAAEAVAQGDFGQQLGLQGPQEVQRVAQSFNTMSAQVQATQQAQHDLLANVSHDLKTPLTAIGGWSQSLLDGTADSARQQQQAAQIINDESARMTRMVNQLLDLARLESGQLQLDKRPFDPAAMVRRVYHSLLPQAEVAGIHLRLAADPAPVIIGDEDRLTQVVTNLLDNALTHTPQEGMVHLRLQSEREAGVVKITVQDSGVGIPPDELPRIFERFYQTDKSRSRGNRSGYGLGLAIARELVQAHGGRIDAYSQVGQGSTFIVTLPSAAH